MFPHNQKYTYNTRITQLLSLRPPQSARTDQESKPARFIYLSERKQVFDFYVGRLSRQSGINHKTTSVKGRTMPTLLVVVLGKGRELTKSRPHKRGMAITSHVLSKNYCVSQVHSL